MLADMSPWDTSLSTALIEFYGVVFVCILIDSRLAFMEIFYMLTNDALSKVVLLSAV